MELSEHPLLMLVDLGTMCKKSDSSDYPLKQTDVFEVAKLSELPLDSVTILRQNVCLANYMDSFRLNFVQKQYYTAELSDRISAF